MPPIPASPMACWWAGLAHWRTGLPHLFPTSARWSRNKKCAYLWKQVAYKSKGVKFCPPDGGFKILMCKLRYNGLLEVQFFVGWIILWPSGIQESEGYCYSEQEQESDFHLRWPNYKRCDSDPLIFKIISNYLLVWLTEAHKHMG